MLFVGDVAVGALEALLHRYGLDLIVQEPGTAIRGSFWGDPEAGVVGRSVYARVDTPVHSLLHETSHVICMTEARRSRLDRDAGSDDLEESAVCYLQVVLADCLVGVGRDRLMDDMDAWGYSFRVGSTKDWFQTDADDALDFLKNHRLLTADEKPTFQLRE